MLEIFTLLFPMLTSAAVDETPLALDVSDSVDDSRSSVSATVSTRRVSLFPASFSVFSFSSWWWLRWGQAGRRAAALS